MIEMSYAHRMDFVNLCRANPKKTTSECFDMYHEWVADTYGDLAVEYDGRKYPPGTWKSKPFKGSILYKGETAIERRAIMAGEYIGPDIPELTSAQEFIDAKLQARGITIEQLKNRSKA